MVQPSQELYEIDQCDDAYFEAIAAKFPKRTQEEYDRDMDEWLKHPLNCREVTPEMLQRPEFQALQQMAYEGTPVEVAKNFLHHATESLSKLLLKQSRNEEKDFQEALYCYGEGLDQKCGDKKVEFELYTGRAKLNMLRGQYGHTKDDMLDALKLKDDEQAWFILARSRLLVGKPDECMVYIKQALSKMPESKKLLELKIKCEEAQAEELKRVKSISSIQAAKDDEKLAVYRNLRSKGVKIGKKCHHLPESVEMNIHSDSKGKLHFPVLILYDEFMATDFIQDWPEDDKLSTQLRQLFNEQAPWDEEGIYRMDTIEVYFEADQTKPLDPKEAPASKHNKKHIKCELNQTILDVLKHPNHIVPQYPVLKIISKANPDFKEVFLNQ